MFISLIKKLKIAIYKLSQREQTINRRVYFAAVYFFMVIKYYKVQTIIFPLRIMKLFWGVIYVMTKNYTLKNISKQIFAFDFLKGFLNSFIIGVIII